MNNLKTPQPEPAVPEGFKLVTIEPTPERVNAAPSPKEPT